MRIHQSSFLILTSAGGAHGITKRVGCTGTLSPALTRADTEMTEGCGYQVRARGPGMQPLHEELRRGSRAAAPASLQAAARVYRPQLRCDLLSHPVLSAESCELCARCHLKRRPATSIPSEVSRGFFGHRAVTKRSSSPRRPRIDTILFPTQSAVRNDRIHLITSSYY